MYAISHILVYSRHRTDRVATESPVERRTQTLSGIITGNTVNVSYSVPPEIIRNELPIILIIFVVIVHRNSERWVLV